MSDNLFSKLKRIFFTKETIEYIKKDVSIFLLLDISNIIISYLNSESTVILYYHFLKFSILNYHLIVDFEHHKLNIICLDTNNTTVKCYCTTNQIFIQSRIFTNTINLFLFTHNRKSFVVTYDYVLDTKIYNPKSDIYLPYYNKNNFVVWEGDTYIYIFSNPETLITTLDILRDALNELGLCHQLNI